MSGPIPQGVVASLVAEGPQALAQTASAREAGAVLVEWRVDAWKNPETAPDFLSQALLPVIFTCRPKTQGGAFGGPETDRLDILQKALALGAAWVDWDFPLGEPPPYLATDRLVLSWHHQKPLQQIPAADLADFRHRKAAVHKLVLTARTLADLAPIKTYLQNASGDQAVFAMGEAGTASRVLALSWGSCWTYAPPAGEPATASGQVDLETMIHTYKPGKIQPETTLFGVIGHPVQHSRSPHLHNPWFRESNLDAAYLPFFGTGLADDLPVLHALGVRGLSITVPFKEDAFRLAARHDSASSSMGATNTLIWKENGWQGSNTDVIGIRQAVLQALYPEEEQPKKPFLRSLIAVVGAGGAARAAAYAFRDARQVALLNRSEDKARDMAIHFNRIVGSGYRTPTYTASGLAGLNGLKPDVLIQCTPVGMDGGPQGEFDGCPVDPNHLDPDIRLVVDMIYAPDQTPLLVAAKKRGIPTQNGLAMLEFQAKVQFEAFNGVLHQDSTEEPKS